MPLDVQPLSLGRRWLRIVVMLALLAASLGFAQQLANRRVGRPPVQVSFPAPPKVSKLPVNTSQSDIDSGSYRIAQAVWAGGPRQFAAFCFPAQERVNPRLYLDFHFRRMTGVDPQQPLSMRRAILGGTAGWEIVTDIPDDTTPTFAAMRLTSINGYIIAFCFSGDGLMTDDDWRFFDEYCARQIGIQIATPPRTSP